MGSTKFKGGSITKVLQVKLFETTPNQRLQVFSKEWKMYNNYTRYTKHKDTRRCKWDQHMSQACPNSTYSIGLLSLATIKALKTQRRWCLPKWDTQPLFESHHKTNEPKDIQWLTHMLITTWKT